MSHGIPERAILDLVESKNTLEDASLSKPIVAALNPPRVIVVTSDYHFERAKYVFEREFSELGIKLEFSICETDATNSDLPLDELRQHEKEALARLRAEESPEL